MNLAASLAVLAASVALLFFGRGRNGDALPILRKISLGSGPTVRDVDIIFILCRSHGRRRNSELATLSPGLRQWLCADVWFGAQLSCSFCAQKDITTTSRSGKPRWDLAISFQCSLIAQTFGAAAVGGASNC